MNGFERRKEHKKESIRRAALELFKAHGIRRVTVKDIAARAAVSQVTIYNYFGSKAELVRDVVKNLILSSLHRYRAIIEGEGPFLEKLEVILFDKYKNSLAFRITFRDINKTLTDKEVNEIFDKIIKVLTEKLKVQVRSG